MEPNQRSFFTKKLYSYDIGYFIERPNRFIAMVTYKKKVLRCHVPDPGRLKELLIKDRKVLLRIAPDQEKMKTDASLIGVLPVLNKFSNMKSEVTFGKSRLDFLFDDKYLTEVKTATFIKNKIALFPDAPTERGTRHVKEITEARKVGYEGLVIFVVPRSDAVMLKPNKALDQKFYQAVKKADELNVKFLVFKCDFTTDGLLFLEEIPFSLD